MEEKPIVIEPEVSKEAEPEEYQPIYSAESSESEEDKDEDSDKKKDF